MFRNFLFNKIKRNSTLLGIGPMSLNCINATLKIDQKINTPLMLIASRRQIDSKKLGGGYVCNWSTSDFSNYFLDKSTKNIILCRDHGGPWQNNLEIQKNFNLEQAMISAKESFSEDIENNFQIIHIDPSIDIIGKLTLEKSIDRLKELYSFCMELSFKHKKEILIEIGTEEQSGSINNLEEIEYTLNNLKQFCIKNKFATPFFIVVQTGTKVMETSNIGNFEAETEYLGNIFIPKLLEICSKYNVFIKQHNTDYLSENSLRNMPKIGIHSANVAPEFAIEESKKLFSLIDSKNLKKYKDELIELCVDSNKWKKWTIDETKIDDYKKALLCCHYVYSDKNFLHIKEKICKDLKMTINDLDVILIEAIEKSINKYLKCFNLIN